MVNFTNILLKALMHADPESAKKTDGLIVFFELLGSASVKAARKMLVISTPFGHTLLQKIAYLKLKFWL